MEKLAPKVKTETFELQAYSELRFEIASDETIKIQIMEGTAEIFGTELAVEHQYTLTDTSVALYSWHGCRIELKGAWKDQPYISKETPMIVYINTHANLDNMRRAAAKQIEDLKAQRAKNILEPPACENLGEVHRIMKEQLDTFGPRVLIVGPKDCGKTTITKILANYAVRLGRKPTLVDIDVGQNMISIPGTVAAVSLERPIDVEKDLDVQSPIVFFYGDPQPSKKLDLYHKCITNLSNTVKKRLVRNLEARSSGVLINTCGWANDEKARKTIMHTAMAFAVNVILVIDHERLHCYLSNNQKLKANNVAVVRLPKSGGVLSRDTRARGALRKKSFQRYFYGPKKDLHPHQQVLGFHQITLCQIGRASLAPQSLLPIGSQSVLDPNMVLIVRPNVKMKHKILALSYAETRQETTTKNVAGFIHVTDVDPARSTMTCLTPCPGPIPAQFAIVGTAVGFV